MPCFQENPLASCRGDRTGNRHRWARRISTGARENSREGTRQNYPVTSREFSRAPVDILLAHLCRFPVRSPWQLARGFSWKHGISPFMARRPPHHVSGLMLRRISLSEPPTRLDPHFRSRAVLSLLRPPIAHNVTTAEQEY